MKELLDRENVFIEPSSCAAFAGPCRIQSEDVCLEYLKEQGIEDKMEKAPTSCGRQAVPWCRKT